MGVSIINKDVSVISSILSRPKASISTVFGIGGWAGGGPASQGPNFPSIGVDRGNGDRSWSDPGNIISDNGQYAECYISIFSIYSNLLCAENFGFSIPTSATINGIEVNIGIYSENSLGGVVYSVELWKGAYPNGSTRGIKYPGTAIPESETVITYGNSSDLWDSSQTPSDINSTDFSIMLQIEKISSIKSIYVVYVDYMNVKVYYTT